MKIDVNKDYSMLNINKFGYHPWYPQNWFHNIRQFFWHFKLRRQRAKYGFCEADLWDMDSYLTELIITMLQNFPKKIHGAPHQYFDYTNDSVQPWVDKIKEVQTQWEIMDHCIDESIVLSENDFIQARDDAFNALKEIFFYLWD